MINKSKLKKATIYLKSGSVLKLKAEELAIMRTGQEVTKLVWKNTIPRLMFISLNQIEAIVEEESTVEE